MQQKAFSFCGASPPDPLTRGSAPGLRWGHTLTLFPQHLLFSPDPRGTGKSLFNLEFKS